MSIVLQFFSILATPVAAMGKVVHDYKEKKDMNEQSANARALLETQAKEFEEVFKELEELREKALPLIKQVEGQANPGQVLEFVDCLSQAPRILASLITSFVNSAKSCKDISMNRAFMDGLRGTDRFMHDFIERMGSTYVAKNKVVIDGSFFSFFRIYKKKLTKRIKPVKIDKEESEVLEKKIESLLHGLNEQFLKRYQKNRIVKEWKSSLAQLDKVRGDIEIDETDKNILKELFPPELRQFARFLDKSYLL
jgi:Na+-transporting methylmalonyl-CoA/oxaloacetate decarboxylase gamma subunit